ncbi:MAG TPA: hypothetical protein VGX24_10455 [Pyrinomonadaceae bacterium]|jgi:hypothetical protein|nr:hypothetical protein [Pyrinomonadaceae bacterium]
MTQRDDTKKDSTTQETDATDGDVGDLETAGETTAAEMIGGAPDTRPVGTGTIADIKITGEDE